MSLHIDLSMEQIRQQLRAITHRQFPPPGHRQVPFTLVETVLCYGLFYLLDPHSYGGANINTVPSEVKQLAAFFRRTPGSITSKMLNLDGSRPHSAQAEPHLFAFFAAEPTRYFELYRTILTVARTLALDEDLLPDFLHALSDDSRVVNDLLGQDDVPSSTMVLLAGEEETMQSLDRAFSLGDRLTETMVERKIRLAQHRFATAVLRNCGGLCVFCGFEPRTLSHHGGLLRASHIKPWAVSDHRERVDVHNGLAACPMHDAAFDQGYLTVNNQYHISRSSLLEQSIAHDPGVHLYFGQALRPTLLLPPQAQLPGVAYLTYHQKHIYQG